MYFWVLLLSCRDQSCTDILEIYNKVKAEDLSSTDEEEVRPLSLIVRTSCLFKFSTWEISVEFLCYGQLHWVVEMRSLKLLTWGNKLP